MSTVIPFFKSPDEDIQMCVVMIERVFVIVDVWRIDQ